MFYEAQTGRFHGTVEATRNSRIGRIESFHLYAPGERSMFQIGRFGFGYRLGGESGFEEERVSGRKSAIGFDQLSVDPVALWRDKE